MPLSSRFSKRLILVNDQVCLTDGMADLTPNLRAS